MNKKMFTKFETREKHLCLTLQKYLSQYVEQNLKLGEKLQSYPVFNLFCKALVTQMNPFYI